MPTLDEVLALAPAGEFDFNIEIKCNPKRPDLTPPPEELARLVLESVGKRRLTGRTVIQSFDFRVLHAARRLSPKVRLSALCSGLRRDLAAVARDGGADMVSPITWLVTARKVRAAHDAGIAVVAWTANRPVQWNRLIRAGVDGIITDDPAALLQYLKKRDLH